MGRKSAGKAVDKRVLEIVRKQKKVDAPALYKAIGNDYADVDIRRAVLHLAEDEKIKITDACDLVPA